MQKQNKYVPFLLGFAVALGVFMGGKLSFTDKSDRLFTANSKKDKLNRLIDYIEYEYVDDINTDSIVDVTVNGILNHLDPHSTYIPQKDLERVTQSMKGGFVGIGVSFYIYNDTVAVIRPLEGGPSLKAGIQSGDRILAVDDKPIYGESWSKEAIVNTLKGEKDTKIKLKIYRPQTKEHLEFTIKRNNVPILSLDAAYMLNGNLGYVKLNRFAESTYKEFKRALNKLQDKGATKLVLDLRDNPGGFLGVAKEIADEFLENNKLILFTKNKKGAIEKTFATRRGDFEDGEIFVLINEKSASASEILAGALQDNDKGTIVGRRSFGKGLVQREMALGDGSAVRLTVSRYYTPTGRSIQRSYEHGNKNYYHDYHDRKNHGELTNASKIEIADSLKFVTPKGKIVYGGGGIVPDVFVPINLKMDNPTINNIKASGIMSNFIFETLDQDRTLYANIEKDAFIDTFEISDDLLEKFKTYLNNHIGYKIVFVAYKTEVKLYLKAALAEQLYSNSAYVEVLNTNDNMLSKVIELSKD
ncbi:MAG: S41 family peptidase [Flavobacteriaceae bacterium]|nr:S41 family peptidase [Flavobacteriaceae bacterium]